jgi:hypothetical protein
MPAAVLLHSCVLAAPHQPGAGLCRTAGGWWHVCGRLLCCRPGRHAYIVILAVIGAVLPSCDGACAHNASCVGLVARPLFFVWVW